MYKGFGVLKVKEKVLKMNVVLFTGGFAINLEFYFVDIPYK